MRVELFGKNKDGSYKVWRIEVSEYLCPVRNAQQVVIEIEHGKLDGRLIDKHEFVNEGKQGRTPFEQAVLQAEARVKKQIDKGYRHTKEELDDLPLLAMLAKDFSKDGKESDVEKGVYISNKLDGVRCTAECVWDNDAQESRITIKSRTGQPWNVPHIENNLYHIMSPGDKLDGELYVHGEALQDILSAVKRVDASEALNDAYLKLSKAYEKYGKDHENYIKAKDKYDNAEKIADIRERIQFVIFDVMMNPTLPFSERITDIEKLGSDINQQPFPFSVVEYRFINTMDELREAHKLAVEAGYEGLMFRTQDGVYESGKRSDGLWKFKIMVSGEFLIVDVVPDKQGYAVFVLENNIPSTDRLTRNFNCVMGDMGFRADVMDNRDDYMYKYMTVDYQTRYKETLLPQFGVGKMIRKTDNKGNPLE